MSNKKVNHLFLPLFYQFQGFFHPLKSHYAISGENYALIAESSDLFCICPDAFQRTKKYLRFSAVEQKSFLSL